MSLSETPQGEEMMVVRVAADGKTRRHLENLGIMAGASLIKLSVDEGNTIVRVHDSRIALNSGLAQSIVVRRSPLFA